MSAQPDARVAAEIGRRARLELLFTHRRGRTVLARAYAEPPFRIGPLFECGPHAQMIVVCCGAGVFAGDRLEQYVRVEGGARVLLTSQSALQIHPPRATRASIVDLPEAGPAPSADATLLAEYDVEADGVLDCFWDPAIPFAGMLPQ